MLCNKCSNENNDSAKFCRSCGNDLSKQETSISSLTEGGAQANIQTGTTNIEAPKYLNISLGKLIFLSIITFGLYDIYWFYQNWEAIRKQENSKISPLGRSIFSVFYCNALFKNVNKSAMSLGYTNSFSPALLSTIYIGVIIFSRILSEIPETDISTVQSEVILFNIIWFIISSLTIIPLIIAQKAIIFINGKRNIPTENKYYIGEIILIVMGVILSLLVLIGVFFPENSSNQNVANEVSTYFSNNGEWKEFTSPVGNFKATFPTYPTHDSQTIDIPDSTLSLDYETYESTMDNGTYYAVNVVTYPDEVDTSNPTTNLEGSLNGMLTSSKGNTVVSSNLGYFGKYRSLDYKIKNNTENVYMQGKIIMANKTLYQLLVAYEETYFNSADYTKFIDSFSLY